MKLDLHRPRPLLIFFGSFCAGFLCFIWLEHAGLIPGVATANLSDSSSTPSSPAPPALAPSQDSPPSSPFPSLAPPSLAIAPPSPSTPASSTASPRPAQSSSAQPSTTALQSPGIGVGEFAPKGGEVPEKVAQESATKVAASQGAVQPPPLSSIATGDPQPAAIPTTGRAPNRLLAINTPPYEIAWAHPSNYGERFSQDINKQPATQKPIIVLHETVSSADAAINYFQTPHTNDADQASYHTLVRRNGTVVYLVPPEKRAYGAGNSVFVNVDSQEETVKTHQRYASSVNNFAYHISLESPPDGYGNEPAHSGYSQAQYNSLAWLIGQSTVPLNRITTHQLVDRSGERIDPRSFEPKRLMIALRPYLD